MDRSLLDYVVCVKCRGRLELIPFEASSLTIINGKLLCYDCGVEYAIIDGIPIFIFQKSDKKIDCLRKNGTGHNFYDNDYSEHQDNFDSLYAQWGSIRSQEQLNSLKVNPKLTKYATKFQTEIIYSNINLDDESRILDVGCGYGFDLMRINLLNPGVQLFGCDVSKVMIRQAVANGTPGHLMVSFMERLPFPDSFFDSVFSHEALEHVLDPERCIAEMSRVTRQKGSIVITTPNGDTFLEKVVRPLFGRLKTTLGKSHVKSYKDEALRSAYLKKLFSRYGLRIRGWHYGIPFYLPMDYFASQIHKVSDDFLVRISKVSSTCFSKVPFLKRFLCDQMVIVLVKSS